VNLEIPHRPDWVDREYSAFYINSAQTVVL
jgi:hypothetical protein